jgi:hypothetical protein
MSKGKNLQSVAASLGHVASKYPSQHVPPPQPPAQPEAPPAGEGTVQFSFGLRKSLRKELKRLAEDADMTMRSFVLKALKEKGLSVTDDDLLDLRKESP